MCVYFFNFDHLRIKLQCSDLFWGIKFCAPSLLLHPFIFFYLQALIHGFLWWWASSRLIFSLKWHLQSYFSFSFPLPSNFKKQRTPLMKKIQGLQAPMELHHTASITMVKMEENVKTSMKKKTNRYWWNNELSLSQGLSMYATSIPLAVFLVTSHSQPLLPSYNHIQACPWFQHPCLLS